MVVLRMLVVLPLCGFGEQFLEQGYHIPKPLISVHGKYILYHMIDSLQLEEQDRVLCICPFNFRMFELDYPRVEFVYLREPTKGALHTCFKGLSLYTYQEDALVLMDSDMLYTFDIIRSIKQVLGSGADCAVSIFEDATKNNAYSFVRLEGERVLEIVEKHRISNHAVSGCYAFRSIELFMEHAKHLCTEGQSCVEESSYLSAIIQYMIGKKYTCKQVSVDMEQLLCCGSPNQLCHSLKYIPQQDKKMRFCFDLDGTLVTAPRKTGDYTTVQPIPRNINYVRYLKSLGHTIIIHTARRMKTHQGNLGGVIKDIGKITLDSLDALGIPYDEIYFGKPYADFYIDDKAVPAYSQLQKIIGFYEWHQKVDPRLFNSIRIDGNKVIKTSLHTDKLNAEIHYYQYLPPQVQHFFPKFLGYTPDTSYELEHIESPTASILYVTESLSTSQFLRILESLQQLHTIVPESILTAEELKTYYLQKLEERTSGLSGFPKLPLLISACSSFLSTRHIGPCLPMIHGDPVFTNILCRGEESVFIDMRGHFANKKTLCGDPLYDYAKVYQSLLGYDEILHSSTVSHYYKDTMLQLFWNNIPSSISKREVQQMTLYLLITLLPLHTEVIAKECYDLAMELYYSL